MIYIQKIDGLTIRSGDILCTRDGGRGSFFRSLWTAIGLLIPGEIDHCALYVGPDGRFVEADAHGVTVLTMPGHHWDAEVLARQRRFVDTLVGVSYPLEGRGLSADEEERVRESVVLYCLQRAAAKEPFNFNLLNATNPNRAYCSQLIVDAYRTQGIELHRKTNSPGARILKRSILPEELWAGCPHQRVEPQRAHSSVAQ